MENRMIRLRPYKSCDAETIASWCKDEATYMQWSGGRFGPFPINAASIESKYQNNGGCIEPDNFYPMTAFDESGIVGHFIMRYLQGDNKILRFGWVIIDAEKRGRGYGKQMLILALKYAFEILGVEKVTIRVHEDNLFAYHCYKSIGFTEDATANVEYDEVNGHKVRLIELRMMKAEYCKN